MLNKKGFTLIEVIITIMILSLVFSVLAFSIYSTIKNSVDIKGQSEKLKEDASFFWDMQKKFSTNTKTFLRNDNGHPILVLYNTSGNYYKGLVKSVFLLKIMICTIMNFLMYMEILIFTMRSSLIKFYTLKIWILAL
jgi:prepilin-type N-terminal cleavage/methylation domain